MDAASETDHLFIVQQCESLTFLLFGIVTGLNSICMNLRKTCLHKVLCFTYSLKFWIICITTVLSIQMLVQHFSGGYSFFTCWSVWDMMRHLWNMNPLITGEQPGAKPGMSEQLHSCRRGEGMQAFWSRLSVTGSFLLINPVLGISQQFCVSETLF